MNHAWSNDFTVEQLREAFREINLKVTCQRFAETDGRGRALWPLFGHRYATKLQIPRCTLEDVRAVIARMLPIIISFGNAPCLTMKDWFHLGIL